MYIDEISIKCVYLSKIQDGEFCERDATYEEFRDALLQKMPNGKYVFREPIKNNWAYINDLVRAHQSHAE